VYTAKHFAAMLAVILAAIVVVWRRPGRHRTVLRQVSAATVPILLLGLVPPVLVMPMLYYYTELVAALAFLTALALGGIVWALTTLPSVVRADERARARAHALPATAEPVARLSVVVPASDDATVVRRALDALGDRLGVDDEVVVVRPGASDAADLRWDHPARLVVLDSEPGLGNALRTGVLASTGSRVLVGADRPVDPRDLEAFATLDDAVVLAVGSQPHPSPRRARVLPWLRRALLHTSVEDTEGTYWVDGRWARSFAAVSREQGPAWTTELVLAAQQQGVEVWEVPVPARRSTAKRGGTGRWRDRVGALRDVIGLAVRRDDYSGPQRAGADLVLPGRHPIP
jgi:hypothetical protein